MRNSMKANSMQSHRQKRRQPAVVSARRLRRRWWPEYLDRRPKAVGSGWQNFKDIFSLGEGKVYAVKPDGTLLFYQQIGWQTGERSWQEARQVGTGWADFRQIVPAGDGVILAIKDDGKLLWYKHYGLQPIAPNRLARIKEKWEGPVEIGSGWQGFKKVIALLPVASAPVVR